MRLINTGYTELELHKNYYAPFLSKATMTEVFPGELDKIKAGN